MRRFPIVLVVLLAYASALGTGSTVGARTFLRRTIYVAPEAGPSKIELRDFVNDLSKAGASSVTFVGLRPIGRKGRLMANGVRWKMPNDKAKRQRILNVARLFVYNHIDPQVDWKRLFPDRGQQYQTLPYAD